MTMLERLRNAGRAVMDRIRNRFSRQAGAAPAAATPDEASGY